MTQRQLPSGGFLDEGSADSQLPSGGFLNEETTSTETVTVPAGSLTLTGFAPIVSLVAAVVIPLATLTLTGFAPTINTIPPITITVPAGSLVLTGFAPTVTTTLSVAVPAGSFTLTGHVPLVDSYNAVNNAKFVQWLKDDNRNRVALVQIDYITEGGSPESPVTSTVRLSDKEYFRDPAGPYTVALNSVPNYLRGLSGDRLGVYQLTLGSIEIDNADGEFDYILNLALDGSEVRFYYGDPEWVFDDFRLMYVALSVKAAAPSWDNITISLRDTGLFLNQSIGGQVQVGGTGPNADRSKPLNFGLVHQLECLVYDEGLLTYVHSDTGDFTYARVVRDRGIEVLFTDNGDGTITLDASPDGTITADVLSVSLLGSPVDESQRRVSDAMDYLVGDKAGLVASGRYSGAGPTFTVDSDDDYLIGLSIPERTNLKDFLADLVDTGNCFWAITRLGNFTFGTLRPNDVATLPLTPVNIIEDDLDDGAFSIEHGVPQYYRLQAYMSKNWSIQSDLATSLTPDERAVLTRNGLYLIQDAAVGTTYADAPELYDLTLALSPVIESWLSGEDEDVDLPVLAAWMETRRFMFLPWIETVSFTVGIEFYDLELGDVVNLTLPRFGYDAGELFQVISINTRLTQAKIDLKLIRRNLSTPYPDGWVRVTTDEDAESNSALITDTAIPPVVGTPPPGIGPGGAPIPGAPWFPGNLPGIGGYQFIPSSPLDELYEWRRVGAFVGQVQSFGDFNNSVAMDSTGTYAVVGVPTDIAGPSGTNPGRLDVYGRTGEAWALITSLDDISDPNTQMLGWSVGIADDGTIVAGQGYGGRVHVWETSDFVTWSGHTLIRNSTNLFFSNTVINRDGNVIVHIESVGDTFAYIYKKSGSWSLQQTLSISPNTFQSVAISGDGDEIVFSCGDDLVPSLANTTLRTYNSGGVLSTWSLNDNITVTTSSGNTKIYDGQQIAIAQGNKSLIAMTLPNDQSGANGGSVVLLKRDLVGDYSQIAWLRVDSTSTNLDIGSVAINDDGTRLFVTDVYSPLMDPYNEAGRLFIVEHPLTLSGGPHYLTTPTTSLDVTEYHPYLGSTNEQKFGEAIAAASADRLVVASGDFGNVGSTTVDFFSRIARYLPYLFTTFTGGGSPSVFLSSYTSDIGGGWLLIDGADVIELNGLGQTYGDTNGNWVYYTSIGSSPPLGTDDYFMQAKVTLTAASVINGQPMFSIFGLDSYSNYLGFEVQLFTSDVGAGYKVYGNLYSNNGSESSTGSNIIISNPVSTERVLRIEWTNLRRTVTVFVDGAQFDTYTFTDPMISLNIWGISFRTRAGQPSDILLSEVEGDYL